MYEHLSNQARNTLYLILFTDRPDVVDLMSSKKIAELCFPGCVYHHSTVGRAIHRYRNGQRKLPTNPHEKEWLVSVLTRLGNLSGKPSVVRSASNRGDVELNINVNGNLAERQYQSREIEILQKQVDTGKKMELLTKEDWESACIILAGMLNERGCKVKILSSVDRISGDDYTLLTY